MEGLESSRVGVTTARLFMIPAGKLGTRFEFSRTGWSCIVDTFSHSDRGGSLVSRTCCVSRDL